MSAISADEQPASPSTPSEGDDEVAGVVIADAQRDLAQQQHHLGLRLRR
jgi:hypothetical protein